MILDWEIDTQLPQELRSLPELLQAAADSALRCEGVTRACAVHVRLCDDDAIHEINREYRGVDRATDVLSFPTVSYPKGVTAGRADRLLRRELDDETGACFLGDLIISVPHMLAQAEEYGHSPAREAAYLLVHGICHLMGYDHMVEDEKKEMRAMEEKILAEVGLQREPAVSDEELLAMAREAMTHSYSPYSGFRVGAALLAASGKVYQGCNIENASFGATNCAERTAVFKAVYEGEREFTTIAIAAEGAAPWPCGICRQVLYEFAPGIRVIVTWDGQTAQAMLSELLPYGFGPKELPPKAGSSNQ